ncbi:cobalt transporter [[Brevibacterium] flavum]|uniref:Cobalt transporter n=1 Tax=[Brevibacterium] flavum TaxID=92706 RepID=A0A0F6SRU0_9CORY|nr:MULTISPECIES: cation diffusion facilitator family transporter [Corynebacterium]AKF28544.1 cobalt transporter [[Brevibacterium] flavum]ANE09380.1 cobalt transporter [Corynebacterium glutamicum]AST21789.1 cation transporter [Corynebacterium glutamicum ATCC 14067]KEI24327.1 cobalt transporter [Corynebacterium glutamicum ATCC 14067]KIH72644.1 cobalt transporter [Corynebacterium glutamicum]
MTTHSHQEHSHSTHNHEGHDHHHPTGFKGFLYGIFVPHSHDTADSIDDAMEANSEGIRALKFSLVLMLLTTVLQAIIVSFSGSVALLADTVHNLSDALTAIPLWIAFILSRRAATQKYTYGFNRAEDLAGLFIVAMIALSAIVAAWQAIDRMIDPRPMENIEWVIAAGVIGFLGNEAVAMYRIRVGKRIGSAALVAVVAGGVGVFLGFPLADPIIGLIISAMIATLLVGTIRSVGRRLMDGIEPELVDKATHAIWHVKEIESIDRLRLRWVGHRLHGDATVSTSTSSLSEATAIALEAELSVKQHLPNVDEMTVTITPSKP